jgi:hypothetical protein
MYMDRVPKVGDIIYVDTDLHVWHGADDFRGGKATVSAVRVEGTFGNPSVVVEVEQNPGTLYTWALLEPKQAELEAKFADIWAHPDPDFRPEFNDDSLGWDR